MIWVLIAAVGFAAWLSVVLFFLALCRAAARADRLAEDQSLAFVTGTANGGGDVIDLRVFADRPTRVTPRPGLARSRRSAAATAAATAVRGVAPA